MFSPTAPLPSRFFFLLRTLSSACKLNLLFLANSASKTEPTLHYSISLDALQNFHVIPQIRSCLGDPCWLVLVIQKRNSLDKGVLPPLSARIDDCRINHTAVRPPLPSPGVPRRWVFRQANLFLPRPLSRRAQMLSCLLYRLLLVVLQPFSCPCLLDLVRRRSPIFVILFSCTLVGACSPLLLPQFSPWAAAYSFLRGFLRNHLKTSVV